jgi:hypothetical protein
MKSLKRKELYKTIYNEMENGEMNNNGRSSTNSVIDISESTSADRSALQNEALEVSDYYRVVQFMIIAFCRY